MKVSMNFSKLLRDRCNELPPPHNGNNSPPRVQHESGTTSSRQQSSYKSRKKTIKGVPRAATNQPLPVERLILADPTFCHKCRAKKFSNESKHFCCGDGEIMLGLNGFPGELIDLFVREDELGDHFRQYSRMYNNLFAFSSLGGSIDAGSQKGTYVFKLHGQIYRFVPDLLPEEGHPKYLHLYFYDGQFEAMNRTQAFPQVNEKVIDILMKVSAVNPYARFFRSLREVHVNEHTQIMLSQNPSLDQRVYIMPSTDDVAIIWPESVSSSECSTPHILIRANADETHWIYHHYVCYDPLQYPLLFPYGECGWRQGIRKNTPGRQQPLTSKLG